MSWIALTADDLARKTAELASVKSILLPLGQSAADVITEELASTTVKVRSYAPSGFVLGTAGTIPDELADDALALVRVKVFTRIGALQKFLTEQRVAEAENALKTLRDWSAGKLRVEPAETAAETQPVSTNGSIELITSTARRFTRDTQDGL